MFIEILVKSQKSELASTIFQHYNSMPSSILGNRIFWLPCIWFFQSLIIQEMGMNVVVNGFNSTNQ